MPDLFGDEPELLTPRKRRKDAKDLAIACMGSLGYGACDAEFFGTRADAAKAGWTEIEPSSDDAVYDAELYAECEWCWWTHAGTCPGCGTEV